MRAITRRTFSPPERSRQRFSTSSPEKPKQPASVRSEPIEACEKAACSVSHTEASASSSSIECCAK